MSTVQQRIVSHFLHSSCATSQTYYSITLHHSRLSWAVSWCLIEESFILPSYIRVRETETYLVCKILFSFRTVRRIPFELWLWPFPFIENQQSGGLAQFTSFWKVDTSFNTNFKLWACAPLLLAYYTLDVYHNYSTLLYSTENFLMYNDSSNCLVQVYKHITTYINTFVWFCFLTNRACRDSVSLYSSYTSRSSLSLWGRSRFTIFKPTHIKLLYFRNTLEVFLQNRYWIMLEGCRH